MMPIQPSKIQSDKPLNILNVPYITQIGPMANQHSNDCGAACGVMLIEAYTSNKITVDDFYNKTGAVGDVYLAGSQIQSVLRMFNIQTTWKTFTLDSLYNTLSAGQPVIALIEYAPLRDAHLTQSKFGGPHFVVIVGYDVENIYINDPLWNNDGGNTLAVPINVFKDAWTKIGQDLKLPNPEYSGIVPDYPIGYDTSKDVTVTVTTTIFVRQGPSINFGCIRKSYQNEKYSIEKIEKNNNLTWGKIAGKDEWICLDYTDYVNKK